MATTLVCLANQQQRLATCGAPQQITETGARTQGSIGSGLKWSVHAFWVFVISVCQHRRHGIAPLRCKFTTGLIGGNTHSPDSSRCGCSSIDALPYLWSTYDRIVNMKPVQVDSKTHLLCTLTIILINLNQIVGFA
eukprot:3140122-Amphidinium_carterae.1